MKLLRPPTSPTTTDSVQLELPLLAPEAPSPPHSQPDATLLAPPAVDPTTAPLGPNQRRLTLGERALVYNLKRSSRRTIGFVIDDRGLSITAPRWVTLGEIEHAISEKQKWIFAKLAEWRTSAARRVLPPMEWQDGASLPFLGKSITLKLESPIGALMFDADACMLHLGLPPSATEQQIKDRVQGWLQTQARRLFGERLDVYAERLGVRHSAYALSSAATRWGSCTADGKIRLNWRLVHFPMSLIDYVVAHELAHLKEMNHSPRFWDTVESIFPEFREAREQLRSHPPEYLPAF
ncbi:M48 family metallopeptidase [Ralstonia insidiosa]|uniref:M48 family metallopeptidase n=1 Tax=Ralstonia insidiosa TaxID=190721 RepID=UPI000CEDDB5B|nr:SprT family zinc-dependent metalloprotease [Ralstonia insidiosa]